MATISNGDMKIATFPNLCPPTVRGNFLRIDRNLREIVLDFTWINAEFSKPAHCGMFYSRIMYDRHHV